MTIARLGALLLLAPAIARAAPASTEEARGRFEVTVRPASAAGAPVARMSLDKRWSGDIEGVSTGEMLSYGSPASGNAGYVALERVTGSVKGRHGSFALQQSGAMDGGRSTMTVSVVPGSGADELSGLSGEMTIDVGAGHAYLLRYRLPTASR